MMAAMQTVEEIRREWLLALLEKYKSLANLNVALGRSRTDATLSQIKNRAADSKSGTPRNMGSPLAREIENKLGLEVGTLDHPVNSTLVDRWEVYEESDEATKLLIDYLLDSKKHPLPEWADADARAYIDSLELKIRKWIGGAKSRESKARA